MHQRSNRTLPHGRVLLAGSGAIILAISGCAHVSEPPTPRAPKAPEYLELTAGTRHELRQQPETLYPDTDWDILSLESLIEGVVRANPDLQADLAAYEGRLQRIPQETSLPDPSAQMAVSRSGGGTIEEQRPEMDPAAPPKISGLESQLAYTLQVMQPIPWPKRLRLKGQMAEREADLTFETYNIRLLDTIHEVARLYHELSFEHALLALMREEKLFLEQYLEAAAAGYTVGRSGRQALLKAQTEIARTDQEILGFPGRIEAMYAALRGAVGDLEEADRLMSNRRVPALDTIDFALPDMPPHQMAARAMELLPEAAQLDRQVEIGQLAHALAREDYRPDFMVGLEYMNSAASAMAMGASGRRDTIGVMVGVTIPVPNARRRAQLAEARFIEKEARHRKRALEVRTAAALEGAFEQLGSLADRNLVYDDALIPLAVETYETSRAEYETGMGDYLDLLDALRMLLGLRREQLELKRDYLLLMNDVQRITGARFVFMDSSAVPARDTKESEHE